jgi:hypothetical protein
MSEDNTNKPTKQALSLKSKCQTNIMFVLREHFLFSFNHKTPPSFNFVFSFQRSVKQNVKKNKKIISRFAIQTFEIMK